MIELEAVSDIDSLTAQLLNNFQKNLAFFKAHNSPLAKLLEVPNLKYDLHISPAGLNLLDKSNGTLVFADHTIFDQAKSLASTKSAIYQKIAVQNGVEFEDENRFEITAKYTNAIYKSFASNKQFVENKVFLPDQNPFPIVFYGLGTGLFLYYLDKARELTNGAFVYEPNAEFFVISAYLIDYEHFMLQKSIFLVVGGFLESRVVKQFFMQNLIARGFVRLECELYKDKIFDDAKRVVEDAHRSALRGWGTLEDEIYGLNNKLANRETKQLYLARSLDSSTPIAVIGSGASLEKLLPLIKANSKNMIIFSSGTALKPLLSAGITPDFQIEIERMDHLKAVLDDAPLGDVPLICADLVHPSTIGASREAYLFVRDSTASSQLFEPSKIVRFASPVVGNAALALALEFSSSIYLFGIDVGFKKGAKLHAKESFYDAYKDSSIEALPIRGNLSSDIYTNSLLNSSRLALEMAVRSHPKATVYNLSDGAFIAGTKPLKTLNLEPIDKQSLISDIKNSFCDQFFKAPDQQVEIESTKSLIIKTLQGLSVSDQSSLVVAMQTIYDLTQEIRMTNEIAGNLLNGTIWHLSNALFKSSMQLQKMDISREFEAGKNLIIEAVKKATLAN